MTAIEIVDAVCDRMNVEVDRFWHVPGVRTPWRFGARIQEARAVAAWLMRVVLGMSFPSIAGFIGLAAHKDIMRLVKELPQNQELVNVSSDLWFELEDLMPMHLLKKKVAAFEHAVGLSLS